ncbi:hypothetical protein HDU92_002930 [Lobulomyces angularis]|nr:hypothetical protein HDU92_002930 [Lobulomyces angularis]
MSKVSSLKKLFEEKAKADSMLNEAEKNMLKLKSSSHNNSSSVKLENRNLSNTPSYYSLKSNSKSIDSMKSTSSLESTQSGKKEVSQCGNNTTVVDFKNANGLNEEKTSTNLLTEEAAMSSTVTLVNEIEDLIKIEENVLIQRLENGNSMVDAVLETAEPSPYLFNEKQFSNTANNNDYNDIPLSMNSLSEIVIQEGNKSAFNECSKVEYDTQEKKFSDDTEVMSKNCTNDDIGNDLSREASIIQCDNFIDSPTGVNGISETYYHEESDNRNLQCNTFIVKGNDDDNSTKINELLETTIPESERSIVKINVIQENVIESKETCFIQSETDFVQCDKSLNQSTIKAGTGKDEDLLNNANINYVQDEVSNLEATVAENSIKGIDSSFSEPLNNIIIVSDCKLSSDFHSPENTQEETVEKLFHTNESTAELLEVRNVEKEDCIVKNFDKSIENKQDAENCLNSNEIYANATQDDFHFAKKVDILNNQPDVVKGFSKLPESVRLVENIERITDVDQENMEQCTKIFDNEDANVMESELPENSKGFENDELPLTNTLFRVDADLQKNKNLEVIARECHTKNKLEEVNGYMENEVSKTENNVGNAADESQALLCDIEISKTDTVDLDAADDTLPLAVDEISKTEIVAVNAADDSQALVSDIEVSKTENGGLEAADDSKTLSSDVGNVDLCTVDDQLPQTLDEFSKIGNASDDNATLQNSENNLTLCPADGNEVNAEIWYSTLKSVIATVDLEKIEISKDSIPPSVVEPNRKIEILNEHKLLEDSSKSTLKLNTEVCYEPVDLFSEYCSENEEDEEKFSPKSEVGTFGPKSAVILNEISEFVACIEEETENVDSISFVDSEESTGYDILGNYMNTGYEEYEENEENAEKIISKKSSTAEMDKEGFEVPKKKLSNPSLINKENIEKLKSTLTDIKALKGIRLDTKYDSGLEHIPFSDEEEEFDPPSLPPPNVPLPSIPNERPTAISDIQVSESLLEIYNTQSFEEKSINHSIYLGYNNDSTENFFSSYEKDLDEFDPENLEKVGVENILLDELDDCMDKLLLDFAELEVEVNSESNSLKNDSDSIKKEDISSDKALKTLGIKDDDALVNTVHTTFSQNRIESIPKALRTLGVIPSNLVKSQHLVNDDSDSSSLVNRRNTSSTKALKTLGIIATPMRSPLTSPSSPISPLATPSPRDRKGKGSNAKALKMLGITDSLPSSASPSRVSTYSYDASVGFLKEDSNSSPRNSIVSTTGSTDLQLTSSTKVVKLGSLKEIILMTGFLSIFNSTLLLKKWKLRYFILTANKLYFFKNNNLEALSVGSFHINSETEVNIVKSGFKKKFVLEVKNYQKERSIFLLCEDSEELANWVRALKSAITRDKFSHTALPPPPPSSSDSYLSSFDLYSNNQSSNRLQLQPSGFDETKFAGENTVYEASGESPKLVSTRYVGSRPLTVNTKTFSPPQRPQKNPKRNPDRLQSMPLPQIASFPVSPNNNQGTRYFSSSPTRMSNNSLDHFSVSKMKVDSIHSSNSAFPFENQLAALNMLEAKEQKH